MILKNSLLIFGKAVIFRYSYSIDESCPVPGVVSPLIIPAPQVPNP
jgi:hypothetical protein